MYICGSNRNDVVCGELPDLQPRICFQKIIFQIFVMCSLIYFYSTIPVVFGIYDEFWGEPDVTCSDINLNFTIMF